jgi:hypothetical protein
MCQSAEAASAGAREPTPGCAASSRCSIFPKLSSELDTMYSCLRSFQVVEDCINGQSVSERCAGTARQNTITAHAVTAEQQRRFEAKFAKFFYTTLTPLVRLSRPELKAALAVLGATPPGRNHVGGKLLDEAYDSAVQNVISLTARCKLICITIDGWKKRGCEQGAPLITVVLLLPDGTSLFWRVRRQL